VVCPWLTAIDRATQVWVPFSIAQYLQTQLFYIVCGKPPKELTPEHKMLEQNPSLRTEFYERVHTGVIRPHKATVETFTETGLVLSNGETLEVDVVIIATGYKFCDFPYLPSDAVRGKETPAPQIDLYKFVVPPSYKDLYIIGQLEVFGSLTPAIESQSRFGAALAAGRIPRPTDEEMMKDIRDYREWQSKNLIHSERHVVAVHWVHYIDSLLKPLGANVTARKMLKQMFTGNPLKAFSVFSAVYFGTPVSAQWRLFGQGKKEELARQTILRIGKDKKELSEGEKEAIAAPQSRL
jgi:dimethylaniline monooxygenase (N-oxide forming)